MIRVRGARHNNLKGIDLDLPTGSLLVITGLSGSGKSSLAFDTLYAEGQRRYIETFSPYARQFFDRMDKPRVDAIEWIPPAIALEQRNTVRTTRSTVGTMTEVCDHMKVLWAHLARLHCRRCGRPVVKESPRDIWEAMTAPADGAVPGARAEALVTFELPLSAKLTREEQLGLILRQGFQRLLIDGEVVRVGEAGPRLEGHAATSVTVIQDRVALTPANRTRWVEACEQAYHFGHHQLSVWFAQPPAEGGAPQWTERRRFSRTLHCASCDLEYRDPVPALFSFNHPLGACPECKGFGRVIAIDYDLAIPDRRKTLAGGAVKPWQSGMSAECQTDMVRLARRVGVPLDVPFEDLSPAHQRWVIDGDPEYGEGNEWPQAWYGLKGYFRWLESKTYKMHVRVLLSRYRAYRTCPACAGRRLQPDALLWRLPGERPSAAGAAGAAEAADATEREGGPGTVGACGLTLADFYSLPVRQSADVLRGLTARHSQGARDPLGLALNEVLRRLDFLIDVGVGYLTLDRPTRTLSGGETQRVNLTTCLGSGLVNSLFVLDEPSVGLHARDTDRLVAVLVRLRDLGNTVVVVEHEAAVMRAADRVIDLGPGHGEAGGMVVAQGTLREVMADAASLTGAYLSGRRCIAIPRRRPVSLASRVGSDLRRAPQGEGGAGDATTRAREGAWGEAAATAGVALQEQVPPYPGLAAAEGDRVPQLTARQLHRHNLRGLDVILPLRRLVCLTGVSGSGKSTLAGELLRLLRGRLGDAVSAGRLEVPEAEREGDDEPGEAEGGGLGRLSGGEHLEAVLLVDQSPIGRTPRSNPAVYVGAFDHLREMFAQSETARQRGLGASAFSFNSVQGQCEQCRGAGYEKIEMQFLSDVFIRCPACDGHRYRPHILDVRVAPPGATGASPAGGEGGVSIADVLDMTIDEALAWVERFPGGHAQRAGARLRTVQEVGLGYLRLGQPINTLSGGESQRLKLAGHLVERRGDSLPGRGDADAAGGAGSQDAPAPSTLFVFDEPTTGLHFEDIRILLEVFQRLVDQGHSVLIIEHNLEVLKCADWLIDLGPDAGPEGGKVVVAGPPEAVAACEASHTGRALRTVLPGWETAGARGGGRRRAAAVRR